MERAAASKEFLGFFLRTSDDADRYSRYTALRTAAPVHHSPAGVTLLTRHADVVHVLRDRGFDNDELSADSTLFGGVGAAGLMVEVPARLAILANRRAKLRSVHTPYGRASKYFLFHLDGELHARLRLGVLASLNAELVEASRPRIETIANELIDRFPAEGRFDLVDAYASQVPIRVVGDLLGIPADDSPQIRAWVDDVIPRFEVASRITRSRAVVRRADLATEQLLTYLHALVQQRRLHPGDDLTSRLIRHLDDDSPQSTDELLSLITLLLTAGYATTTDLIATSVWALQQHRSAGRLWAGGAIDDRVATDELLRYASPVQWIGRIASRDCEVGGVHVPAGRRLILSLGSADRDPLVFAEPDTLDLQRSVGSGVPFGLGAHRCPGALLARTEAEISLRALWDREPGLTEQVDPPTWRRSPVFRGFESLQVRRAS